MVFMVVYQAHDGLWHVWDSPLADWQVNGSVDACLASVGEGVPVKVLYASHVPLLHEMLASINALEQEKQAPEPEPEPYKGMDLLPAPRAYYDLSKEDKRRLDIENGQGGDHDTTQRYHPKDEDLVNWSRVVGRIQRGELHED